MPGGTAARVEGVEVSAFTVPTRTPESDGTLEWKATTLVWVEARGGGELGAGYSYADTATARLVHDLLAPLVAGRDALDVPGAWAAMVRAIRNLGRPGVSSMAISAVDAALWDLKAKLLGLPLARLLGMVRPAIPAYGSGGFTSYGEAELREQLGGWAAEGLRRVKMKVGRDPAADPARVRAAREAVGPEVALFVDANGAYRRKQALRLAERFAAEGVSWFEEPVSSDDLEGLRLLRDRAPAGMEVAAGEYGYDSWYFLRMLKAGAVDALQADATRCAGITGFLEAGALAAAFGVPLSSHCAPSLHVAPLCALRAAVHAEYFFDHVRLEGMLLDGAARAVDGALAPDLSRPGLGIALKAADAERFRAPF
ncbi:enolase C-terminal domain-like protein [Anaeromyxobacter paludicola]|uniref:Mandelate racemase n=1 Tax=Anaeromyxobacter paludicola TaxID=2918171 RepID=A0ABN6NER0_9BACT|nr:enolase C-terminal domain-like protein [Anaeromyxobacter paludicola]BDG10530.1 mandelate racemase [Anaeromyxobacter paludicola]